MSTAYTRRDRARRDEQRFTPVRLLVVLTILLFGVAAASGSAVARSTYRVRPGDTLSGIAAAHGLTVSELARLNRLDPQGLLLAGTTLRLTRPSDRARVRYRVRLGDTLSGIAARYDTSVAQLARLNRIDPNGLLPAGTKLLVPLAAGMPGRRPARAASTASVQASILRWAAHYRVDDELAGALAWVESRDQPYVSSPVGAWGVMQVMPATWAYVETVLIGQPIPHTPDGDIRVGLAYLHHLLHAFAGDRHLALAGYLQGEQSVRTEGVLPSSLGYIAEVLVREAQLRSGS
jgi:LysM repeat protein